MAWQIDEVIWERADGAGGWTTDALTIDNNSFWTFRAAFKIVDVPTSGDPINAGNFQPQRDINGAGWTDYFTKAKNLQPGYTIGLAETAPTYVEWSYGFVTPGTVNTRFELEWTGGPYYPTAILVTVNEAAATKEIAAPGSISGVEIVAPGGFATEIVSPGGAAVEVVATAIVGVEVVSPGGAAVEVVSPGGAAVEVVSPGGAAVEVVSPGGAAVEVVSPGGAATEIVSPGGAATEVVSPGVDDVTEI